MPAYEELIDELSDMYGIVPEYWDIFGNRHKASTETELSILKAMGLKIDTPADIIAAIEKRRRRPWNIFIDPVKVIPVTEQPIVITVHVPVRKDDEENISFKCCLSDESGQADMLSFCRKDVEIVDRHILEGIHHLRVDIRISITKDIGYYTLDLLYMSTGFGMPGTSRIIITPETCYVPGWMESSPSGSPGHPGPEKHKSWGLCVNLYALVSRRNWGIGDFTDLGEVVEWIAGLGGGFVGINPLHATLNRKPSGISPYSPISRLYKNFVYLDIEAIPDAVESDEVRALMERTGFQKILGELRDSSFVDYEKAAAIKNEVLKRAFEYFYENHYLNDSPRATDFKHYIESEGPLIENFALFQVLQRKMEIERNAASWRAWPPAFRDAGSPEVQEVKKANKKEILFYQYVQWLIEEQHREIGRQTRQLGMPVGLYHDLAVGSSDGGFDAWMAGDIVADGIDVGAPPDDFNPSGQNWGFPPLDPEKLRKSGYDFLIQTIRKNMKHAGALRIDHALGMFRLFWIPRGAQPEKGAYVRYPSEDILRIIALESVRNKTVLIAEDLGTVGEDVRETLFRFRMLRYKLLYFERNYPDPSFKKSERYADLALCAVTTHDLPTLYGYWAGRDIQEKTRLGLYPDEKTRQRQIDERERDKSLLLQALKAEGLLPEEFSTDPATLCVMMPALCLTIHEFLSRTPCRLLAVNLDDMVGTMDQQNMPGTTDAYPNWLQKAPIPLNRIMSKRSFTALSKIFKRNHR